MEEITRTSFIYDFMTKTQRPAHELTLLLAAFDESVAKVTYAVPEKLPEEVVIIEGKTPEVVKAEEVVETLNVEHKPKRKYTRHNQNYVLHDGTTRNVHPRAKMVEVEFFDRHDYYGSITAAAQALKVTREQVRYAISNKKLLNGHTVKSITWDEFTKRKG